MKWWHFIIVIVLVVGTSAYRKSLKEQVLYQERIEEMTSRLVSMETQSEAELAEIRSILSAHSTLLDAVVQTEQQLSDMLCGISEKDSRIADLDKRLAEAAERAGSLEELVEEKKKVLAERDDLIERARKYTTSLKKKIAVQARQGTNQDNSLDALKKSNADKDHRIAQLREALKRSKVAGDKSKIKSFDDPHPVGSSGSSSRTVKKLGEK